MHRCPYLNEDRTLAKLRAQTSALRRHGFDASLHLIRGAAGQPARQIAATAAQVGADLVIVGTRGRSPAAGALLGSVTQRLLHISTCPVLVVPSPSPAGAESVEPPPTEPLPSRPEAADVFLEPGRAS